MLHRHLQASIGFFPLLSMWFVMMAAMMAPTAWPWVQSFHRLSTPQSSIAAAGSFAGGYLAAWFAYSAVAASLQLFAQYGAAANFSSRAAAFVAGSVWIIAGGYQLARLKRACLTHCRSPLSYFLTRWRNGPAGGFRMGLDHGIYCVGCCWAMMATMLVTGIMNFWWMFALACITLAEQARSYGEHVRILAGVVLVTLGLREWWAAF